MYAKLTPFFMCDPIPACQETISSFELWINSRRHLNLRPLVYHSLDAMLDWIQWTGERSNWGAYFPWWPPLSRDVSFTSNPSIAIGSEMLFFVILFTTFYLCPDVWFHAFVGNFSFFPKWDTNMATYYSMA